MRGQLDIAHGILHVDAQFAERGRLRFDPRDEDPLVHLVLELARPPGGCRTRREGLALLGVAPLSNLDLPSMGAALAERCHGTHSLLANECDNAVTNDQSGTATTCVVVFNRLNAGKLSGRGERI